MYLPAMNRREKCCLNICVVSQRAALMLLLLVAATTATSTAQTFKTLYNFCSTSSGGVCLDGRYPLASLVQGANGDLYGTTAEGGANNGQLTINGTVFRVTTAGKLKTIYNFCSQPSCTDGNYPNGGLLLATDGNFYGVTSGGGAYNYGTVFKITAAGKLKTIYNFCSQPSCADGEYPEAGLIQATNGNFLGTASVGGAYGQGTAFEMTPSGTIIFLYSFCGGSCADGGDMKGGLMQAADGNFYGTAYAGGGSDCYPVSGGGTFFQLTPSGMETTLAPFCQPNGFYPDSAPVQAANGNFYGTTAAGGDGNDAGTFYEMTPAGSATWWYNFCLQIGCPDGSNPQALILGTDGNFYGPTSGGGANDGKGTVFKITPTGQLTTLHSFSGDPTDGTIPNGPLLLDTNGTFYGTTFGGGTHNDGTIFSIATGLGPFVETMPTSGAVGTNLTILERN